MANHLPKGDKMPKGKPFVKGDPRAGRPKDSPELRTIKRLTRPEFELLMQKLLNLTPNELNEYQGSVLEMSMASIIKKSIEHGDHWRLQFFIERLFGKVTDKIELTDKTGPAAGLARFKTHGK